MEYDIKLITGTCLKHTHQPLNCLFPEKWQNLRIRSDTLILSGCLLNDTIK